MFVCTYICMVVCIYVRTSTAGTHSFLQPARHFVNCILVLAGLLPLLPVGRAPGGHATHVHTYVRTCIRYTHTHKLRHRHWFSLGHSLEWLPVPDGLSLQFIHTCLQVSELFIGLSKLSLQRLRTYRQATCTYVRTYVHSCAHSFVIRMYVVYVHAHVYAYAFTCTYVHVHVQYIHTYVRMYICMYVLYSTKQYHTHLHIRTYVSLLNFSMLYVYTYIRLRTCVYACTYVCTYIQYTLCPYVHTYVCMHIPNAPGLICPAACETDLNLHCHCLTLHLLC